MSALPFPIYGLDKLYLFPYYQTREDYQKALGVEPPAWDDRRPPKYWFDPSAATSSKRSMVYDQAIVATERGQAAIGTDGMPVLDVLVLKKEEAATVNIPPKQQANAPGAEVPEVPPPIRKLAANEELFFQMGGVVAVRNTDLYPQLEVGFTATDRAMLRAIAQKLGV